MKKLFLFAIAIVVLASCSKDDATEPPFVVCPTHECDVISFESSEGLKDIAGDVVVLGDIELESGSVGGKYKNVFWAKGGNFTALSDAIGTYAGYLCSTADEKMWFTSYFSKQYGDFWGGFSISANATQKAAELDYANNHFSVWASTSGANETSNCLIGFDNSFMSEYALPTIDLVESRRVSSCYLANSAITYTYTPSNVPQGATFYYKIIVTGYLDGVKTGCVHCMLMNGKSRVEDWTKFDISSLGNVDKLTFSPASNDANAYGILAPAYFAVDEIAFEK